MITATGSRKPWVVIHSSMYFQGHQLYDQRLARALATNQRVLYVEPATPFIGRSDAGRRAGFGLRSTEIDSLNLFTPVTLPYGRRAMLFHLTSLTTALQIWVAILFRLRTFRFQSIFIAISPVTKRFFPSDRSVTLVKDDYAAGQSLIGISERVLQRQFRQGMTRARNVVVVSPLLRHLLLSKGLRADVVPAGCEIPLDTWPEPAELAAVPTPRAVFVGMISDRIDLELLRAVASSAISVVAVGGAQPTFSKHAEWTTLQQHENFHWFEPRSGADLEAVIQHCDVGLVPYELTPFNRASFPLKAFEYLACGKPVVSTVLPSMVWLNFKHLHTVPGAQQFVESVRDAAAAAEDPQVAAECVAYARENTWDTRATRFREILERP